VNACPKCKSEAVEGTQFDYPQGKSRRIHFRCDSYGYTEDPFRLAYQSDLCSEKEELFKIHRINERLMTDCDKYRRNLELIAEDCEAWLNSENDEPSAEFIKLVAKYAREAIK
jgi:phosphoribosyl 1,2-cyclic phosphodiesterase